jgi:ectoine hydroxylase-related dioxygenase (phytanoyl-CoA dioxygenase family)
VIRFWPLRRRRLPAAPMMESDGLDAYLAAAGFDAEAEAFVRTLARDGMAEIDLGDEGRALCDQAVAETEAYFETAERVQDAWRACEAVRRLATLAKVRRLLAAAYGRKPFAFQTLSFRRGTEQSIHTDTMHFHSAPERFMCGVWIALEDIAPEAGPLRYVVGSHRLPVMTMRKAGLNHDRPTLEDYSRYYIPALHRQLAEAGLPEARATPKKGTALVWAANLAHGGAPIADPASTRRSLVTHYYFEDCLYYTPMSSDVEGGRYDLRLPPDVATGRMRWPRVDGRRMKAPLGLIRQALERDLRGRPHLEPKRDG